MQEELESQESLNEDNGPVQEQESYESQDDYGDQSENSNSVSEKELLEQRLEEEKLKSQENIRNLQSNYDKKITRLEGMIEALTSQQSNVSENNLKEKEFVDDYGDPRAPTAEELAQMVEERVNSVLNRQSEEQQKIWKEQEEHQRKTDQWLSEQKDKDEVLNFYNSNKNFLDSEMNDLSNFESRYYYVRAKVLESKLKKQKNKPNVPPVGNPGQSFSSRPKSDNGRNAFESAMSRNFQKKLENRAPRFRGR